MTLKYFLKCVIKVFKCVLISYFQKLWSTSKGDLENNSKPNFLYSYFLQHLVDTLNNLFLKYFRIRCFLLVIIVTQQLV